MVESLGGRIEQRLVKLEKFLSQKPYKFYIDYY
jgi:hypothetical protein